MGEVDLVLDPPFQDFARRKTDPKLSVTTTGDLGTQYFSFDQARDELLSSDVKGRNPFNLEAAVDRYSPLYGSQGFRLLCSRPPSPPGWQRYAPD